MKELLNFDKVIKIIFKKLYSCYNLFLNLITMIRLTDSQFSFLVLLFSHIRMKKIILIINYINHLLSRCLR